MQTLFLRALWFLASLIACLFVLASPLAAQQPPALVTQPVDNSVRTVLPGNAHPLAGAEFDRGEAPSDLSLKPHAAGGEAQPAAGDALCRFMENNVVRK